MSTPHLIALDIEFEMIIASAHRTPESLTHWLKEAQRRGVRRVIAIEARDNHAAIDLEREKGFAPEPFEGDPSLVILSKTFR